MVQVVQHKKSHIEKFVKEKLCVWSFCRFFFAVARSTTARILYVWKSVYWSEFFFTQTNVRTHTQTLTLNSIVSKCNKSIDSGLAKRPTIISKQCC